MHEVQTEIGEGIGVIRIDRPHARNAIGLATIDELGRALDELDAAQVSVVVLTGGGDRAFVSGGDLKELEALRTVPEAADMARRMRRVLDRVSAMPVPVIAALNGHALGGGAEVAVACDVRVAADDVRIGFTQASLAIMPAWGGTERLVELVGRGRALLLIGAARVLDAEQAQALGLVDEIIARASFEAGWREIAARMAQLPPEATRALKHLGTSVRPGRHPHTEEAAIDAFARLWVAPAHWEAAARVRGGQPAGARGSQPQARSAGRSADSRAGDSPGSSTS